MRNIIDTILDTRTGVAASFNSPALTAPFGIGVSFQCNTTGMVGAFTMQESNDNVNFVNSLNALGAVITANVSGTSTVFLEKPNVCSKFQRVAFTFTSGTGTSTIIAESKG